MPVYEVGEHEILKEGVTLVRGDEDFSTGTLYLSNKRLIYERKGRRGFLRATSPITIINVPLYDITNVATAVPRVKVLTRRTLTVEFVKDDKSDSVRFEVGSPKTWESKVRQWIEDSKRLRAEELRQKDEETHRRKVEMARAKAGTTNVGMVNIDMKGKSGQKSGENFHQNIIEADEVKAAVAQTTAITPVEKSFPATESKKCRSCGESLDGDYRFCPTCGARIY